MISIRRILTIATASGIALHDITPQIRDLVAESGIGSGFLTLTSRHTTTAITINENEERLLEDVRRFFTELAPPGEAYLHNDIHLRDCPPEEPENAHSHLMAMMLGSTESIPVVDGELVLGTWQSVLFFELDGPRRRTLNLQILGS